MEELAGLRGPGGPPLYIFTRDCSVLSGSPQPGAERGMPGKEGSLAPGGGVVWVLITGVGITVGACGPLSMRRPKDVPWRERKMCFSLMDQLSGGFQTLSLSVLLMGVSVMISSESESCCLLNAGGGVSGAGRRSSASANSQ